MKLFFIIKNILKNMKSYLLNINIFYNMPTWLKNFSSILRKPFIIWFTDTKPLNLFADIKIFLFKKPIIKHITILYNTYLLYYSIIDIYVSILKTITIVIGIAFTCFFMSLFCLLLWAYWGPIFFKGDPIVCPHYKKTYYYEGANYCYFDFYPYFNEMKRNLNDDPTKAYYKWIYYYDWNHRTYYKMEFVCVYKIGVQRSIWVFETDDVFYIDKTERLHYIPNLLECRIEENWMLGEYFEKFEPKLCEKEDIIKRVYNDQGLILGFNINIGEIRYEFDIGEYKPNPKR